MCRYNVRGLILLLPALVVLSGCEDLIPRDTRSLLFEHFQRSEIFGFIAGFGTTFAALPDLIVMLKRRSCAGMSVRILTIMAVFQVLWVYYGLLIGSRPVIAWNVMAVLINLATIGAQRYFARQEKKLSDRSLNAAKRLSL